MKNNNNTDTIYECRKCGIVLDEDNWYPSYYKRRNCICKGCNDKSVLLWQENNRDKTRSWSIAGNRKRGKLPMSENKDCASFLGIHIAERVLSMVFKDVVRMPNGNTGYDVICNHGKLIDVKSSCMNKRGMWVFNIRRNAIADYFLCIAFDNRDDLNPMHIWLLPGSKFNHLKGTGISPNTVHKWDGYNIDINKVITCCDILKGDKE